MADKKVTESRPGRLQVGLAQGKQKAADSGLPTGRMQDRILPLSQEAKIRNTIYRSRRSTAVPPDAVGV
ncbi:hypothetical protein ACFOSC_10890 [Streptantibioticus rubrisoli]|uniref:Uncharacterized protein n=1 Tax=Streptantibioticus rubrisoli TaxID=1387313 RepID=A0ABT1PER3_9ACTN|nr:hypothetical protein [Streptantibioticus rubrisoli]MCQ4042810.1 hypothetical protein [Streptantibioticus rubrisoli]